MWGDYLACAAIVLAALAAYHGIFSSPLVFDDIPSIRDNPTIRHLWTALSPPRGGLPVSGRPVVNLSFAMNYALGGANVWGYHAANLAVHILAGLTLFGIMRRTFREESRLFALATALLWIVHPLQTESVTYISQRAESLMGLFFLLTLYFFIRSADGEARSLKSEAGEERSPRRLAFRPSGFPLLSILFCLLGMATKEVMVAAPVIVLLYDRTFVAGCFREAWRRRRGYYLGLGCTWLLLAWLVAGSGNRGGSAGFGTPVPWWKYAAFQSRAIAHYLRLSIWPHPLVIDYGRNMGGTAAGWVWDAAVVTGLLAATAALLGPTATDPGDHPVLRKRLAMGFAGAFFFIVLAPSSSFVPVATEIIAEHRMYLPLAAVMAVVVAGIFRLGLRPIGSAGVCLIIAAGFGVLTAGRNEAYRSSLALWSDAVANVPGNAGARANLGNALMEQGSIDEAIAQYRQALKLAPEYAEAYFDLGYALVKAGRLPEAIVPYEDGLRLKPGYAEGHFNLGKAFMHEGRMPDAIAQYREGLRLEPEDAGARNDLGVALARNGRTQDAMAEFEQVLRRKPGDAAGNANLADALFSSGRASEAIPLYEEALRSRPDFTEALANLGLALASTGRPQEAIVRLEKALQLQPNNADIHYNYGLILREMGRAADAQTQFEEAARLQGHP